MPVTEDPNSGIEGFEWVGSSVLASAACLTWVHTRDLAAVARSFGASWEQVRPMTLARATGIDSTTNPVIAVRVIGEWVLVVELNGWQGNRPEVLRRACATGPVVSTYWSNGDTLFSYAEHGQVLTTFEATFPQTRQGVEPDRLTHLLTGLPQGWGVGIPLMLEVSRRVTGVALNPAHLAGEFDVVPVTPHPPDVPPTIDPDQAQLTYSEPVVAYHLRHASATAQRSAARVAVEHVIALSDVATDPRITRALGTEPPTQTADLDSLTRETPAAMRRSGHSASSLPLHTRYYALAALRAAAGPDPLAAAFVGIHEARTGMLLNKQVPVLRAAIMRLLTDPPPPTGSLGLTAIDDGSPTGRHQWITRHWLAPAGGIVVIPSTDPDLIAAALHSGLGPAHNAIPYLSVAPNVAVRTTGTSTVLLDTSPYLGIDDTTLQELSTQTGTITWLRWRAAGSARLHQASGGRLITWFDPAAPGRRLSHDPELFTTHLAHLPPLSAGVKAYLPLLLALVDQLTGVTITPQSLDEPHTLRTGPTPP